MARAAQTSTRLIDQRARGRTNTRLMKRHQEEWDAIYAEELVLAQLEAQELQTAAPPDPEHPAEPPRMKSGPKLEGQTSLDRLDVARCSLCIANHDRGHACPKCGSVPKRDFAGAVREIHRLYEAGTTVEMIAVNLRIPKDHVLRLLDQEAP